LNTARANLAWIDLIDARLARDFDLVPQKTDPPRCPKWYLRTWHFQLRHSTQRSGLLALIALWKYPAKRLETRIFGCFLLK
jgi:hypothetical protein